MIEILILVAFLIAVVLILYSGKSRRQLQEAFHNQDFSADESFISLLGSLHVDKTHQKFAFSRNWRVRIVSFSALREMAVEKDNTGWSLYLYWDDIDDPGYALRFYRAETYAHWSGLLKYILANTERPTGAANRDQAESYDRSA